VNKAGKPYISVEVAGDKKTFSPEEVRQQRGREARSLALSRAR
jgi:hypothetical protein